MLRKIIHILILSIVLLSLSKLSIFALTDCPTSCSNSSDCQKRVECLNGNISELRGQANTLSSQIAVMDNQINLAQARIDSTKQQISDLTLDIDTADKKIGGLAKSLDNLIKVLLNRMVTTYEIGQTQPFEILVSSTNATNFFSRLNYLKVAQAHDKQLIYLTQQAKNDYANQKNIFEDKKKKVVALKTQLENYTKQLEQNKVDKKRLLAETQGSESTYQSLLAEAQTQLAGFSGFAESQGGASILTNQTVCDDWGCYYNQRDSRWGTLSLDGTGYTIASDGCLVTSMAMVVTHYGNKDTTPITINSDRGNFASYNAAYLNYALNTPSAVRSKQSSYYSSQVIDSQLSQGRPVIVGIRYSNGNTHFVVLISGSNGDYLMNDPFVPNGHKIKFTDHYSLNSIYEIDYISV